LLVSLLRRVQSKLKPAGASAGVGRATAQHFARSGASLALLARNAASLDETKAEMEMAGASAMAFLWT
jgi:short-subunit dehydrogenase